MHARTTRVRHMLFSPDALVLDALRLICRRSRNPTGAERCAVCRVPSAALRDRMPEWGDCPMRYGAKGEATV